jgi:hypothetical protein
VPDGGTCRRRRRLTEALAAVVSIAALCPPASAAGIDSRTYTCAGLHALIAERGFVFISQATFGDFVVARRTYCSDGEVIELRSVATSDNPECLVNYCVSREPGRTMEPK